MVDLDTEIAVLATDLEMIQAALHNAAGLSATHDLQYQFLQMRQNTKRSPLTAQLERAVGRVDGYLHTTEEEENEFS